MQNINRKIPVNIRGYKDLVTIIKLTAKSAYLMYQIKAVCVFTFMLYFNRFVSLCANMQVSTVKMYLIG